MNTMKNISVSIAPLASYAPAPPIQSQAALPPSPQTKHVVSMSAHFDNEQEALAFHSSLIKCICEFKVMSDDVNGKDA